MPMKISDEAQPAEVGQSHSKLKFHKPFQGKPTPIKISGLFLPSPETMIKLTGLSISGNFKQIDGESLFKRLQAASSGKIRNEDLLAQDLLEKIPPESAIHDRLRLALAGCQEAKDWILSQGMWSIWFMHKTSSGEALSYSQSLLLQIEKACALPQKMVTGRNFKSAAECLALDSLMRMYLSDEAPELIADVKNQQDWDCVSSSITLEVLLSHLAAVDAENGNESDCSHFTDLLPVGDKNPTQRYFAWIKQMSDAESIRQILDDERAKEMSIDETTLKRWSSGRYLPNDAWLNPLLDAFFDEKTRQLASLKHFGARYLNFIGHFATRIEEKVRNINSNWPEINTRPWPNYPFGHANIQEWCAERYPHWHEFHRAQLQKQGR